MTILRNALLAVALAAAGIVPAGCAAQVRVTARATPRLVWIAPGVWVVEDSPWAVYYADGYYWRYVDGVWYRSSWYDDGFVRWDVTFLPPVIVRVHRPHVYVHYRARPGERVRVIDHRTRRPVVRDHRKPVTRDHRNR
jgi:hypothetical protein